jgi:hypothetical protein
VKTKSLTFKIHAPAGELAERTAAALSDLRSARAKLASVLTDIASFEALSSSIESKQDEGIALTAEAVEQSMILANKVKALPIVSARLDSAAIEVRSLVKRAWNEARDCRCHVLQPIAEELKAALTKELEPFFGVDRVPFQQTLLNSQFAYFIQDAALHLQADDLEYALIKSDEIIEQLQVILSGTGRITITGDAVTFEPFGHKAAESCSVAKNGSKAAA